MNKSQSKYNTFDNIIIDDNVSIENLDSILPKNKISSFDDLNIELSSSDMSDKKKAFNIEDSDKKKMSNIEDNDKKKSSSISKKIAKRFSKKVKSPKRNDNSSSHGDVDEDLSTSTSTSSMSQIITMANASPSIIEKSAENMVKAALLDKTESKVAAATASLLSTTLKDNHKDLISSLNKLNQTLDNMSIIMTKQLNRMEQQMDDIHTFNNKNNNDNDDSVSSSKCCC